MYTPAIKTIDGLRMIRDGLYPDLAKRKERRNNTAPGVVKPFAISAVQFITKNQKSFILPLMGVKLFNEIEIIRIMLMILR